MAQAPGRQMPVPRLLQPVPGQRSGPSDGLGPRRDHRDLEPGPTLPETSQAQTHHTLETHPSNQERTTRLDLTHRPPLHQRTTRPGTTPWPGTRPNGGHRRSRHIRSRLHPAQLRATLCLSAGLRDDYCLTADPLGCSVTDENSLPEDPFPEDPFPELHVAHFPLSDDDLPDYVLFPDDSLPGQPLPQDPCPDWARSLA